MKNLKLVIFDMDGLIFDTESISYQALKQVLKESYDIDFPMDVYRRMIGMGKQGTDSILKETYGDTISLEQIAINYATAFKEIINTQGIDIKLGATALLDYIDEQGFKKCIASSSSRQTIKHYLALTNLTDRFDFYLSGDEVENGKPHPDIFLEACQRAGEAPEHALVLEDSVHGFRAAKSAGINCIVIPDLIEPTSEMTEDAYHVLPDLEKVIDYIK